MVYIFRGLFDLVSQGRIWRYRKPRIKFEYEEKTPDMENYTALQSVKELRRFTRWHVGH